MFGKTKKIASKISEAILADFRLAFTSTKYLSTETGQLSFPFQFFEDEYVRGFITGYTSCMVSLLYPSMNISLRQRDDIAFRVWERIAGLDAQKVIIDISKINEGNQGKYQDFFCAYDEATFYVGSRLGMKVKEGVNNSVYNQALDMAGALHGATVDLLNNKGQVTTSSSIASALFLLTIKNHIEKQYLS